MSLQAAEESLTRYAEISNNLLADDGKLLVRFYLKSVPDAAMTAKEGRPIHREALYIRVMSPGDALNIIDREFWNDPENPNSDINRFGRAYALWKEKGAKATMGTPLAQWPLIARSTADDLAYFKITTVEALAAMSDEVCQRAMGWFELRKKAQDYLNAATSTAHLSQMREEINEKNNQIDTMAKQLKDLQEQIESIRKSRK